MRLPFQFLFVSLTFLTACTPNAREKPSFKKATVDTQNNSTAPPAQPDEFTNTLQGEWKRTTYPYGSIIFRGDEVKIKVGEGAPEPPRFEKFRFSDSCPFNDVKGGKSNYLDFLVREGSKACDAIRMVGDTLYLGEAEANRAVAYTRVAGGMSTTEFTIPKSVQGTWAVGKENCMVRNHNRITVSARSIAFFERTAELTEVIEYEPTRIVGLFKFKKGGKPFRIVLDAKEGSQVLIMREWAKGISAAPAKYERCEAF